MPAEARFTRRALALGVLAATPALAQPAAAPSVVASFSILADMTRAIAPADIAIAALVGPGGDAHVFEPRPTDARRVAQARVLIVNGLGFDSWAERLAQGVGFKGRLVRAAQAVQALKGGGDHGHSHDVDPHAWQDVAQAQLYARAIGAALVGALPERGNEIAFGLSAYEATLTKLDRDIRAILAPIPPARRVLVTSHSSMNYFARAYGLRILAAQGLSTASEPSAAQIARLIRQIRQERIAAVFLDTLKDPRLIERIQAETGARAGGKLFADSLSPPGGPAPTYVAMMRHNAQTIAAALTA
jgi:zinc/manganese transport system substrate-binding protein